MIFPSGGKPLFTTDVKFGKLDVELTATLRLNFHSDYTILALGGLGVNWGSFFLHTIFLLPLSTKTILVS